jgi:hypothetical protein
MTDLSQLAKSLTKAQHHFIVHGYYRNLEGSYQVDAALVRKGIHDGWMRLTPLGEALRAHLKGQSDEG